MNKAGNWMPSTGWKCPSSTCQSHQMPSSSLKRKQGEEISVKADSDFVTVVEDIPSSPMMPLYLSCGTCSIKMITCECCLRLLDAEKEVDGILLCKICGFLTVLNTKLRSMVHISPFSRRYLKTLQPHSIQINQLKQRLHQVETTSLSVNSLTPSKKTKKELNEQLKENKLPVQPVNSVREKRELQAHLQHAVKAWQHFLLEAENNQQLTLDYTSCFSDTHLHILKVIYAKAIPQVELNELCDLIHQFLQHQSTLLKLKHDVLSSQEIHNQMASLSKDPTFEAYTNATKLLRNTTKEQCYQRYLKFRKLSRHFLRIVGIANKHLFGLYKAAQGLTAMDATYQNDIVNGTSATSIISKVDSNHIRSRRKSSSTLLPICGNNSIGHGVVGTNVLSVQQNLEYSNRLAEITKKIELWRLLSWTIGTTCVFCSGYQ